MVITVNHTLSFGERLSAGHYDRVDPDINEKNFPLRRHGQEQEEIKFFHFNRLVYSDKVIAKMKGLPPIGIEELFAIGEQCPDMPPIVALGAVWQYRFSHKVPSTVGGYSLVEDTMVAVPCTYQVGGKRELGLQRFFCSPNNRKWDPGWCFPAINRVIIGAINITMQSAVDLVQAPQGA